jgi:hypothetical protein
MNIISVPADNAVSARTCDSRPGKALGVLKTALLVLGLATLGACKLYSLADACGPEGGLCIMSTSGSSSGGTNGGLLPGDGGWSAGTRFAEIGTLACEGSPGTAELGAHFYNQGILASPGVGTMMQGTTFMNQGGLLGPAQ